MPVPQTTVQPCATTSDSTGSPAGLLTADQAADVRRPVQTKELLLSRLAAQSAELNVVLAAILRALCERKQYQDQQLAKVRSRIIQQVRKRIKENQVRLGCVFGALQQSVQQRVQSNSGVLIECQTRMLLGECRNESNSGVDTDAATVAETTDTTVSVAASTVPTTPAERCCATAAAAAAASATAVATERVTINFPDREKQRQQDSDSTPEPSEIPIPGPTGIGAESDYVGAEVPEYGEPNQ